MVKNIILDVGMVLVDFCWQAVMRELGLTGDAFEAVADATVRSTGWSEFDRSVQTDAEALAGFLAAAPDYREQVQRLWDNLDRMIVQYPYAKPWIASIKEAGYQVYILSNYSRKVYELTKSQGLDFLPLADGAVFSFETGYVKPEKEIYHFIMDKYGLSADECVFVDDTARNLTYPKEIGWGTVCFQSLEQAQEELKALGCSSAWVKL